MMVFAHPESGRHSTSVMGVGILLKLPSSSHSLLSCRTNANNNGVLDGFVIIGKPLSSRLYVLFDGKKSDRFPRVIKSRGYWELKCLFTELSKHTNN